jgi:hypothetical protein
LLHGLDSIGAISRGGAAVDDTLRLEFDAVFLVALAEQSVIVLAVDGFDTVALIAFGQAVFYRAAR